MFALASITRRLGIGGEDGRACQRRLAQGSAQVRIVESKGIAPDFSAAFFGNGRNCGQVHPAGTSGGWQQPQS